MQEFVGYFAGFCSALAQFPQAYKIIKTKDTKSISLGMYIIMTIGIFCWLIYGFLLSSAPMILANGICLLPSLFIIIVTILNLRKEKENIISKQQNASAN